MPIQSTLRSKMKVADGTKLMAKLPTDADYVDLGVVTGDVTLSVEWEEIQEESANAGKSDLYVKNPTVKGAFNLQQLDLDNISRLASGLMTKVTTPASATTSIPDQTIAAGWDDAETYELVCYTSSSDSTKLKFSSAPTITSVTLNADTPETLTAGTDYVIVDMPEAVSRYGITFISANMSTGTPKAESITIDYGSSTPVARDTYHIGTSVQKLTSFALKLEHTDTAGLIYGREIHECYTNSGSLAFNFKSAAETGFNEMAFSFTGVLNSDLTEGRQLMSVYEDSGAV